MTHQIKISERESEAFPLSCWGCSLHGTPSSWPPPPARSSALLHPCAACDEPHRLPSQLTAFLLVFWETEGVEDTAPLKLGSRWSRLLRLGTARSSSSLRHSGVEAGRLDLGPASLETLARKQSPPHPQPGRTARPFPTSGAQGRSARCLGRSCSAR